MNKDHQQTKSRKKIQAKSTKNGQFKFLGAPLPPSSNTRKLQEHQMFRIKYYDHLGFKIDQSGF